MTQNVAAVVPPAVVTSGAKVTLADHLELKNLPLAATPAGRNFVLKALHPSESTIKVNRGPGGDIPSVCVAADVVDTIPVPDNAVSAYYIQTANPAILGSLIFVDADDTRVSHYVFTNSALALPGTVRDTQTSWHNIITPQFKNIWEGIVDYRVTAQSVTMDLIAPQISDQGTIVSSQFACKPRTLANYGAHWDANDEMNYVDYVEPDMWIYGPRPPTNALLMGTSAYTAKAREGFYQPLKLAKFKYMSAHDLHTPIGPVSYELVNKIFANTINSSCTWPYILYGNYKKGDMGVPKPSSNIVGLTFIEGFNSSNVSLRFRVRQNLEMHVTPGSVFAPMTEAPIPPDELAYKMYIEISQRMKDGYPASYNDTGKLRDIIGKIGKGIMKYVDPALDIASWFIPGIKAISAPVKAVGSFAKELGSNKQMPIIGLHQTAKAMKSGSMPVQPLTPVRPAPAPPKQGKRRRRRRGGK